MTRLAPLALLALPIAAQTPINLSVLIKGEMTVHGSPSTLTIGICSVLMPCNVRQGSLVRSYIAPATISIIAGTGTVYLYVDQSGNLAAGIPTAGIAVMCSGCLVATGVASFPIGSVPLATWTALNGVWTQGTDLTATLSSAPSFTAGPNVTLTQTPNNLTIGAR